MLTRLFLVAPLVLLGLTACGDDEGSGDSSGGSGDFCTDARAIEESESGEQFLSDDPAVVEAAFHEFVDLLGDVVDSAPDEIKDEIAAVRDGFAGLEDGLEAADWNYVAFVTSPEGEAAYAEMEQADFDALDAYLEDECGILSDGS